MKKAPILEKEMEKELELVHRFFEIIEEEFSSIKGGEVIRALVNMYVNTVCIFGDSSTEENIKLGIDLIEDGFEKYKRIQKEEEKEEELKWRYPPDLPKVGDVIMHCERKDEEEEIMIQEKKDLKHIVKWMPIDDYISLLIQQRKTKCL